MKKFKVTYQLLETRTVIVEAGSAEQAMDIIAEDEPANSEFSDSELNDGFDMRAVEVVES